MALSIQEIKKKKKALVEGKGSSSNEEEISEESRGLRPWESFKKEKDLLQLITEKKDSGLKGSIIKDFKKSLLIEKEKQKEKRIEKIEELERNKVKGISPQLKNKIKKISDEFFSKNN